MKTFLRKQKGLTLIEVLISLALFAIAMLGVALFMGKAISTSIDDNVRGIALYTATNELEKLFVAGGQGAQALSDAIDAFDTDGEVATVSTTVVGNGEKDAYTVAITAAIDNNNINVLTDANPSTWESPITMAVRVTYDANPNIAVRASYTFVF